MTNEAALYHGRACPRCYLAVYGASDVREGWCLFCRAFADEVTGREDDPVKIWRLQPDKKPRTCLPSQLGTWDSTGRQTVGMDLLDLRDGTSASLTTSFLCVDYWAIGREPLLFETRLYEMNTGASYDRYTRRYATYAQAAEGHAAARARLLADRAVLCKW